MRNQYRLGALQMCVARHHGFAGRTRLLEKRFRPSSEIRNGASDCLAHIEPQIGRNLLVATAASVQLKPQRAHALHQFQFHKVMNILGGRMVADERLARIRSVFRCNRIQRASQLRRLPLGEDTRCAKCRRVRLARRNLLRQQPPVKRQRPLPRFELWIERLTKAAGPHLHGLLFVRH